MEATEEKLDSLGGETEIDTCSKSDDSSFNSYLNLGNSFHWQDCHRSWRPFIRSTQFDSVISTNKLWINDLQLKNSSTNLLNSLHMPFLKFSFLFAERLMASTTTCRTSFNFCWHLLLRFPNANASQVSSTLTLVYSFHEKLGFSGVYLATLPLAWPVAENFPKEDIPSPIDFVLIASEGYHDPGSLTSGFHVRRAFRRRFAQCRAPHWCASRNQPRFSPLWDTLFMESVVQGGSHEIGFLQVPLCVSQHV